MEKIDCVVIGAGVVGLAVARALALKGRDVLVLEAANAIGTRASSRNSEVIHAGIYYAAGSLKARFCVQGKEMLYAYCDERGVEHRRCGKLIVATSEAQIAQLEATRLRATANGVHDLALLTGDEARELERHLACRAALHSPGTGIIDSHAYMLALQGDLERAGGVVVLNTVLAHAECAQEAIILVAEDGTELAASCVVNAAGAQAQDLARRFSGLAPAQVPPSYFCKGNYFTLSQRAPFSRLIYPVPEAAGLGVHLTLDMGGQAKFGPDVEWVDSPDDLVVDASRSATFYAEVRKYWPALADGALVPDYAGIRAKIQAPGEPARDFLVQGPLEHGVAGLVNLFGIESPGLTSSLAIAAYVSDLV
jgi:L-2-hydroxyglutarate oxidase LhgO